MDKIGYVSTPVPNLKTGKTTLSGFSSGGFKTSYILSYLPGHFAGYGIFSGSYGDI